MPIDPRTFRLVNVADTCAVWNVLSSALLHSVAKAANCDFCMTGYVLYECLFKPRGEPTAAAQELMRRLRAEQERSTFQAHQCTIDDLQEIARLEQIKPLGKGELSCIAFAKRIGQAVLTDDQGARRLATQVGVPEQTTPHLLAWLLFVGRLGDADVDGIIAQHKQSEGGLERHFRDAYGMAMMCKMLDAQAALAKAGGSH